MPVIFFFVLTFLPMPSNTYESNYEHKSFLCSTQSHSVKGGFVFTNTIEVVKYNILISSNGKNFIKKTLHCYKTIDDRVLISLDSLVNGCGKYHSYINSDSLIYNVPFKDKILYAQCKLYDSNLESKLEESLNK